MAESGLPFPPGGTFDAIGYIGLLTAVYKCRTSGLLTLTNGRIIKKVYLGNGHIAFASSNDVSDRLGDILLKKNIINQGQYDHSSKLIRETGKKQGTILVQMGALDPKELFRGLILQITEISESPFLWKNGNYSYAEIFDREEELIVLKINPANIIREGLWKITPSDDKLSSENTLYRINPECPFEAENVSLSPLEKKILSAVPRGKDPKEISSFTKIPLKVVIRSFQVLSHLGFLTAVHAKKPVAQKAAVTTPEAKEPSIPIPPEVVEYKEEIVRFSEKMQKMNYYQILGLEPDCNQQEIKRAYIKKAKEFHPDRFYQVNLEDISSLANKIFMNVNEAYETLSDADRRREYNKALIDVSGKASKTKGESDLVLASEQFKKGVQLLKSGETWDAADAFRWAVRLNPEHPLYHSYLGLALLHTGRRLKEAEEHLKTAITLDYNNPQYYVNLGLIYKKGRVMDKAVDAFKRALKLDPQQKTALREIQELTVTGRGNAAANPSLIKKLFGK